MPRSPFYARIKRDVIAIVSAVPPGRVVTFAAIGRHIDVVARHPAYILAMLDEGERIRVPWHRAVAADGKLGAKQVAEQRDLLRAEGVTVDEAGVIADLEDHLIAIGDVPSGVALQSRPQNAPVSKN